jgi:hypothetical protein
MKARLTICALGMGLMFSLGVPLGAIAGPTPGGADTDGDGVANAFDNCTTIANGNQADVDHDGCGNVCDILLCDVNKDGIQNITDFNLWLACFNQPASCNPGADCNNHGIINIGDFNIWLPQFNVSNGPSGIPASHKSPNCP